METKEVMFNGKKINIVTKLDEAFKEDSILTDRSLEEDTMDLTDIIEQTQRINIRNDINE